ncbi:MAG: DUF3833 family protein [Chromatiales bacterium]|nr:DUF3833 family protein [Chromatiales bacterium]
MVGPPLPRFLLAALFVVVAACGRVDPAVYEGQPPSLDLRDFLQGGLTGWGVFQDRSGEVTHRFRIDMQASWEGDHCTFIEDFHFSDGRHQRREWLLREESPGRFTALANDSAEPGEGQIYGNSLHWNYLLNTPTEHGVWPLRYDYWMYKIDERTLMNRARVSLYGVEVGQVSVLFQRER